MLLEEGDRTPEEDELLERLMSIPPKGSKEKWRVKYVGVTISGLVREAIEAEDFEEEIRLLNKLLKIHPNNKRAKASLERAKLEQKRQAASLNGPKSMKERGSEFRGRLNERTPQVTAKAGNEQGITLERKNEAR